METKKNTTKRSSRVEIMKTYKIYIGGKFPRTESGRYYTPKNKSGKSLGNICLCSRKDLKEAVVAARAGYGVWASASAFNRGQVIYRIAEMLEGRREQFISEMMIQDYTRARAVAEFNLCVERIVHYAGWADKYQQIFSSVNPVSGPYFNFSQCEPVGCVGLLANENSALLSIISNAIPAICGGNSVIILSSESKPLCAVSFAEVIHSSDVPAGVVNILTGNRGEILPQMAAHMDIQAMVIDTPSAEEVKLARTMGAENLKRIFIRDEEWGRESAQSPYFIIDTQEIKTTWHPIELIGSATSNY